MKDTFAADVGKASTRVSYGLFGNFQQRRYGYCSGITRRKWIYSTATDVGTS
jgi:hypothetical protein